MRFFWIVFGVATQVLFALTVCRLFPFLQGGTPPHGLCPLRLVLVRLGIDFLLAVQFAIPHSYLLLPQTRERLKRLIPGPQYGCFFCTMTCLTLLLTIECWQPIPVTLWSLHGVARQGVRLAFLLSWPALLYSLHLTGLGYQTGLTPWWAWLRGRPLVRRWERPGGPYRYFRHPIYLSFLGLVWFTPTMTLDRAMLTAVWTVYIFVGSVLKDRRLVHYVGDSYRAYQARVPGYPFLRGGPLGRIPQGELVSPRSRVAA